MEKISKNYRILNMYQRLCSGKCLNKQEEAKKFGVDERSIQRDIDDIRAFLTEQADNSGDSRQVVYDRIRKGYVLTGAEQALMSNDEILAVSKILLESRAFTKKEIKEILDKMILGCVPQKNMKLAMQPDHFCFVRCEAFYRYHPDGRSDLPPQSCGYPHIHL